MNSAMGYTEGAEVPEDKTKDNELIAQFMGQHVTLPGLRRNVMVKSYYADELKYDSDWSWLMPVVEKINQTKPKHDFFAHLGLKNLTIDSLYKAAIKFIKWYNLESLKNKPI